MPMKFRFRWIPFVAALLVAAIGISLGQWQTRRAIQKDEIAAKMSARESAPSARISGEPQLADELEYRRVVIRGEFVRDWTVYLDNRPHQGAAGFYVLTPMKIDGADMHVLIVRGWVRRDVSDRTKLPSIMTPDGPIEIEGIARKSTGHVLQLGKAEPLRPGAIVQNLDVMEFAQAAKLRVQPLIVEQLTDTRDALVRDWPQPSTGAEKHRGYAFQWYALAATALIFFVVTGFRRGTS
jgi:surfeit locus 1 family protein